jgi:hypothetical protein
MTGPGTNFDDLGLDRSDIVDKIVAAPPTLGAAAGTLWREFAHSRGKARWGEKRPAYWREMDVILRLFPRAQVIHLVRDARSCVASLKQLRWWRSGVIGAVSTWTLAERELRRVGAGLPADSYYRLRYEDLLTDPHDVLARLCAFLEEPFDDAMLDHVAAAGDIVPARKRWHRRTRGAVDPGRIAAWRQVLSADEVGLVERVAGRALAANGYERSSGCATQPGPRALLEYYVDRERRVAAMYRDRALDSWRRQRYRQPLADLD